jgi:transcriptional regulator with XRE-family HTH domain
MVLLRHLLGDALRRLRLRQGRTLREVSAAARVSLGYLSEVERGQKEASSELLAAICSALGAPLSQVFREVSDNFALAELQSEPMLAGAREPALEAPAAVRHTAVRHTAVSHTAVGMDAPVEAPKAFSGAGRPAITLPSGGELGDEAAAVLDAVRLRPGQPAAFDDEAARRIRDITDMVTV